MGDGQEGEGGVATRRRHGLVASGPARGHGGLLLAALVALGALLRLVAIGREDLWGDEALTLIIARFPPIDLLLRPVDPTGAPYYWLHRLLVPLVPDAGLARLPAFVAGVLIIPACYLLGRQLLDRRAGLQMAMLAAVSPPLIDHAQEARAYSLLVLLVTLSAAGLAGALRGPGFGRRQKGFLALAILAGILACYTHLLGFLWLGPATLFAMVEGARRKAVRPAVLLLPPMVMGLLLLPELFRLHAYFVSPRNEYDWLVQPSLPAAALMVLGYILQLPKNLPPAALAALTAGALAAVLLWPYAAWRRGLRDGLARHRVAMGVATCLIAVIPLTWLVGELFSPIFIQRSFLPALPGLFLLLVGLARIVGGWRAIAAVAALWLVSALSAGLARDKFPWGRMAATVAARAQGGDVLVCPDWRAPAFLHAAARQGKLGGAVITFTKMGPVLVKPRGAFEADPLARFRDAAWAPQVPASDPAAPRAWAPWTPSQTMTVVRYECSSADWARLLSWVAPAEPPAEAAFDAGSAQFRASILRLRPSPGPRRVIVR